MNTNQPGSVELCAATYRATQVPGEVIIFAEGIHPTSGYKVFFELSPIDIFPPEFILWHVKPSGIVLPVLTPFMEYTSFKAADKIDAVFVHDANGRHKVPVEQAPDLLLKHGK